MRGLEPGVLYVDTSTGSRMFAEIFRERHKLKVALVSLKAGDFAFTCGHKDPNPFCEGDNGCAIAVERKTLSDLDSSLVKNRLGGKQIPDMLSDYTMAWVVVEGVWRSGLDDAIEMLFTPGKEQPLDAPAKKLFGLWYQSRGTLTYSQINSWMIRYDVCSRGQLARWRTMTPADTAAFVVACRSWWQKDWKKHHLNAIDKMPPPIKAMLWKPTQLQRTAASLEHIGVVNSKKIGKHFGSILEMVNASEDEWRAAGLGKADAAKVWTAIRRKYR